MSFSRTSTLGFSIMAAASLMACGAGTGIGVTPFCTGGTGVAMPALSTAVQPILTANCALSGCHAGTAPEEGMNLSSGQTFSNTVNVAAQQVSSLVRVCPGAPDLSYLVHKLQGTQATVGGSGSRMPLGATPLSQTEMIVIRMWITTGAANN